MKRKLKILWGLLAFVLIGFLSWGVVNQGLLSGSADLSSRTPSSDVVYSPTPEHLFIANCADCNLNFFEPQVIAYEDDTICGKDRQYFKSLIQKIPSELRDFRHEFPEAQVPRECFVLIMKTYLSSAQKMNSNYFARCQSSKHPAVRKNKIHCIDKDYVNSIYNAYIDVADCLNIPQKEMITKLSNESGLHLNAFGTRGDAGIGQLTADAIDAVLEPYWMDGGRTKVLDYFIREMGRSTKPSCKRIMDYPAAYAKVSSSLANRCSLMSPAENPYRNILYTGIYYRILLHQIAGIKYVAGYDYVETDSGLQEIKDGEDFPVGGYIGRFKMKKNLEALGVKDPDMYALIRAMVTLGYNAGPGKAAEYFNVYLKKRLQAKKPLKKSDLDFLKTDFVNSYRKITGGLARPNNKASPALKKARQSAHTKPLPEYLMLVQQSGAAGYLSHIADKHKYLIRQMGDNRCVSEHFLQF